MRPLTRLAGVTIASTMATSLLLTGCEAQSPAPSKAAAAPAAQPVLTTPEVVDDLLFVAKATSGTLDLDADGHGSLTLTSVPTMSWFSDRPKHDAGTTATLDALKAFGWKKNGDDLGKGDQAPNAALIGDNLPETLVVELGDVARDGDDLTFSVSQVGKDSAGQRHVDLGRTELFIDSVQPLAEGAVVGKISGCVFNGIYGCLIVEGDVIETAARARSRQDTAATPAGSPQLHKHTGGNGLWRAP